MAVSLEVLPSFQKVAPPIRNGLSYTITEVCHDTGTVTLSHAFDRPGHRYTISPMGLRAGDQITFYPVNAR